MATRGGDRTWQAATVRKRYQIVALEEGKYRTIGRRTTTFSDVIDDAYKHFKAREGEVSIQVWEADTQKTVSHMKRES